MTGGQLLILVLITMFSRLVRPNLIVQAPRGQLLLLFLESLVSLMHPRLELSFMDLVVDACVENMH